MTKLEFKTNSLLGDPTRIEVRQGGRHLGNIRQLPNGLYQYYKGPRNQLSPGPQSNDLEDLKNKIAQGCL